MYDVFISYAHIDDEPPVGAERGWVSTFADELEKELRKKTGGATVWRDKSLASNDQVTPTLLEAVRSSRALVLFLSPSYQKSEWCQRELGAFLESNPARNHRESVFIVEVEPVDRGDWHPRLRELTQISLCVLDKRNIPRRLGHPFPKLDEDGLYWQRLNELAHLISLQLARSPACSSPPEPQEGDTVVTRALTDPPPGRPTIWVAEPTLELLDRWADLAGSLRQAGWDVRPAGTRSYDRRSEETFLQAVRSDLHASRLFVQLLGGVESAPESRLALLQAAAAREQAQERGVPFLQWLPPEVRLETLPDEAYRRLVAGVVSSRFEEFRSLLLSKARAVWNEPFGPPVQRTPPPVQAGEQSLAICVSAEQHDKDLSEQVGAILADLGVEVLLAPGPTPEQPPADYNALLDEVIELSEGMIIIYGECPPAWVLAQYVRARKALAHKRQGLWAALVEGPPKGKPRPGVSSRSIMTLDCTEGARAASIAPFVHQLREAASA